MKRITFNIAAAILFCGLMVASCSLLLNSQERKMVGKWHEKFQYTEDFTTVYIEGTDEYKEDKTMNSSGKMTIQYNIGTDGYNFTIYVSVDFETEGTWQIGGDNLISKNNVVNFSDVRITSATELDAPAVQDFKKSMKDEVLSPLRDELLKKDTTEIVLLNDTEYKYKDDEGKVYTMTKVK